MFNLNTESATAQRKAYTNDLLTLMVQKTATDLINGYTTREIGVKALAIIVGNVVPNTGKGHAATVLAQVDQVVDDAIAEINATQTVEDDKAAQIVFTLSAQAIFQADSIKTIKPERIRQ